MNSSTVAVSISVLSLIFSTFVIVNNREAVEESNTKTGPVAHWLDDDLKEINAVLSTCQKDADGIRVATCFGPSGQRPTCSCMKTL